MLASTRSAFQSLFVSSILYRAISMLAMVADTGQGPGLNPEDLYKQPFQSSSLLLHI